MSAHHAELLPPLQVDKTLGPLFIGFAFAATLYGTSNMQFYTYFRRRVKEPIHTTLMVFCLWILSTLTIVFSGVAAYHTLVTDFLNPLALSKTQWSIQAAFIFGVVSDAIIAWTYAERLRKLGNKVLHRKYVALFMVAQVLLQVVDSGFEIAYALLGSTHPILALGSEFGWLNITAFTCNTISSGLIAVSMCFTLYKMKTGFRTMDSLIWTLIRYSISTSVLTSLVNIIAIVSLAASPHSLIYSIADSVQPSVNFNSLLAFLNHKDTFHQKAVKGQNQIQLAQLSHEGSNAMDTGTLVGESSHNETGLAGASDRKKDIKNAGSLSDFLDVNGDHSQV